MTYLALNYSKKLITLIAVTGAVALGCEEVEPNDTVELATANNHIDFDGHAINGYGKIGPATGADGAIDTDDYWVFPAKGLVSGHPMALTVSFKTDEHRTCFRTDIVQGAMEDHHFRRCPHGLGIPQDVANFHPVATADTMRFNGKMRAVFEYSSGDIVIRKRKVCAMSSTCPATFSYSFELTELKALKSYGFLARASCLGKVRVRQCLIDHDLNADASSPPIEQDFVDIPLPAEVFVEDIVVSAAGAGIDFENNGGGLKISVLAADNSFVPVYIVGDLQEVTSETRIAPVLRKTTKLRIEKLDSRPVRVDSFEVRVKIFP